jgi:aryl-alcohol dehydrogenase-like predicted oxidoreductase
MPEPAQPVPALPHRALGRTGLEISTIGYGAFKIGRNQKIKYPQGYDLPDEAASERLLNAVLDLGITLIDTAPAYGLSEERIGRALAHRRREFVLSTKVGERWIDGASHYDFSAPAVRASLETSLKRLRTDALDVVFIHSDGNDHAVLNETDVVAALDESKRAGLTRAVGFSGKSPDAALAALEWADVLMIEYHPDDTSHAAVLPAAAAKNVGIVVKKGLASGRHAPAEAIPFVLNNPAVTSLIIGGLNLDHMRENIEIARRCGGSAHSAVS